MIREENLGHVFFDRISEEVDKFTGSCFQMAQFTEQLHLGIANFARFWPPEAKTHLNKDFRSTQLCCVH